MISLLKGCYISHVFALLCAMLKHNNPKQELSFVLDPDDYYLQIYMLSAFVYS